MWRFSCLVQGLYINRPFVLQAGGGAYVVLARCAPLPHWTGAQSVLGAGRDARAGGTEKGDHLLAFPQLDQGVVKLLAEPLEVMLRHGSRAGDMVNRVHGG